MSDSIIVRVTLDSAAILHPETRVYVQIPEVARTEYLLPAERYEGLRDRAWPEVLDVAQEHAERGWAVAAPAAAARAAVAEWLRDSVNRDEMQAAWELDQARRNPVAREWHSHIIARDAEIERLKARLAEYERPADEDPIRYTLTEQAEEQCGHPNGYGPNGCAGCGAFRPADDEDDVTPQVRKLRGILAGQREQVQGGDA